VIIFSLGLEVQGRSDIIIDLTKPGSLEDLNKHPFTIKEGATFRMKARFKVQHQILSGLKYIQVVSRMGVKNKMQEMIVRNPSFACAPLLPLTSVQGSYSPNTSDKPEYEKKCSCPACHFLHERPKLTSLSRNRDSTVWHARSGSLRSRLAIRGRR